MACGLAYNADAAKASVDKLWADLNALKASIAGEITPAVAHEAVTHYRALPTFQVNWALAGTLCAEIWSTTGLPVLAIVFLTCRCHRGGRPAYGGRDPHEDQ